ncbi:hypothetical protein ACHAWF_006286 [Thalassiosira exigua]
MTCLDTSKMMFPGADKDEDNNKEGNSTSKADDSKPKKPTRPLTAYHLFFQLEREYILQTKNDDETDGSEDSSTPKDDRPTGAQLDEAMPVRYRNIHLSPHWYASGSGKRVKGSNQLKKRRHRKTHGKIGFEDLSKCVAARWSKLEEKDGATKIYVQRIAARELEKYRKDMASFKASSLLQESGSNSSQSGDAGASEQSTLKNQGVNASQLMTHNLPTSVEVDFESKPSRIFRRISTMSNPDSQRDLTAKGAEENAALPDISSDLGKRAFDECSFHPVPSSYWKKYRKGARGGEEKSNELPRRPSCPDSEMPSHQFRQTLRDQFGNERHEGMQTQQYFPSAFATSSDGVGTGPNTQQHLPSMYASSRGGFGSSSDPRGGASTNLQQSITYRDLNNFSDQMNVGNAAGFSLSLTAQGRASNQSERFFHESGPTHDQLPALPMQQNDRSSVPQGIPDGSLEALGITADDALVLMKALSDSE